MKEIFFWTIEDFYLGVSLNKYFFFPGYPLLGLSESETIQLILIITLWSLLSKYGLSSSWSFPSSKSNHRNQTSHEHVHVQGKSGPEVNILRCKVSFQLFFISLTWPGAYVFHSIILQKLFIYFSYANY